LLGPRPPRGALLGRAGGRRGLGRGRRGARSPGAGARPSEGRQRGSDASSTRHRSTSHAPPPGRLTTRSVFKPRLIVTLLQGPAPVPRPASEPAISVVVTTHNELRHLRATVSGLRSTLPESAEIVVVDDQSTDGSTDFLDPPPAPGIRLVRSDT